MCSTKSTIVHRSGFVALAGRPNVGKSTLINQLVGQPVAAVSPKPQTTRNRQLGILTLPNAQIIFIDTPGIHKPLHTLGEHMNMVAENALEEADLLLVIFDLAADPNEDDLRVVDRIQSLAGEPPIFLVLNKMDAVATEDLGSRIQAYANLLPQVETFTISATQRTDIETLLQNIILKLPEGPQFYDAHTVTDTAERDVAADLIRAAALRLLRHEVPHSIAIRIDEYIERQDHGAYIAATLFVERESQKSIVIGKGGRMLREIGTMARLEIERMSGRKVFLRLRVKVLPGWRNDRNILSRFDYGKAQQ